MSSDTRIRSALRKQIRWLCNTAQNYGCPPGLEMWSNCPRGDDITDEHCAECWREASRKAVKENDHA